MKRAFLIHGWEGFPEEGWRPWLKKKLEDKGFKVIVPAMPDTKKPTLEVWLPFLQKLVGKPTENDFFVGHSLGCITILRFIEHLKEDGKSRWGGFDCRIWCRLKLQWLQSRTGHIL